MRRPEQAAQRALFQHIRQRGAPGLVAIHCPNGGYRAPAEAKILAGLGVTKGAPDVLLWHAGRSYAVELKSANGRLSPAQRDMLDRLSEAGCCTAIAYGLDDAIAVLEEWRLLRGSAQ